MRWIAWNHAHQNEHGETDAEERAEQSLGVIAMGIKHAERIDGAEALRNTLLIAEVDPDERPEDEDEYYDHQLIDLDVVTVDGEEVGRITEISHLPTQDLFIVERPDGTEALVPFVAEIVTEIDLERQRAVIDPPPGLIDDRAEIASARDAGEERA